MPDLTLADVTAENWRGVADLAPRDDQRDFVSTGVEEDGELVMELAAP